MTVLDKKISELNAGGAAQSGDELIVARSGSNVKVTGANVAAAATSVGTLSSLTVSGDLTVDTSTLKVDSANNRVGVGTASPRAGFALDVVGGKTIIDDQVQVGTETSFLSNSDNAGVFWANTISGMTSGSLVLQARSSADGSIVFVTGTTAGTERARITAGGNFIVDTNTLYVDAANNRVGIGTASPTTALDVRGISNGLQARFGNLAGRGLEISTAANGGITEGTSVLNARGTSSGVLVFQTQGTERARITTGGNFIPGANNAYSLGDGSTRWTEVFAINGTINTSDANAKTDVQEDVPGWEFIKALRPVHYVWKVRKREAVQVEDGTELVEIPAELDADGNEIAPASTEERPKFRAEYVEHPGVRRHLGFIAQEVKEALGERDFGLFTQDAETGECGLRYDQFAAPFAKVLQEAMARIETLEARLAAAGIA